jgi:hypothetical protein
LGAECGDYLVDEGGLTLFVVFEDVAEDFDCSEAETDEGYSEMSGLRVHLDMCKY